MLSISKFHQILNSQRRDALEIIFEGISVSSTISEAGVKNAFI